MYRLLTLSIALLSAGCIFSGGEESPSTPGDMGVDVAIADMGPRDSGGSPDASMPDPPDMTVPGDDMEQTMPDMGPPPRLASSVCVPGVSSTLTADHPYRLRTNSTDSRLLAAYSGPMGADSLGNYWSRWESSEGWTDLVFVGTEVFADQAVEGDPTGVAVVPGTGQPGGILTRRNTNPCIYAEFDGVVGPVECEGAWGAEVANYATLPQYFWFGENGTISSLPTSAINRSAEQITVSWCAQNPESRTDCLPLEYGKTDARANRGPNVMISDSLGRAYLWNAAQVIDASKELDCAPPPTPPLPLVVQGMPVMFADADVVRAGGSDYLVHQTISFVTVYKLDENFQLGEIAHTVESGGQRSHFDAVSDGTRIAAVSAGTSSARVFAFGADEEFRDVTIDDDTTFRATSIGVEIKGDQVAVVAGGPSTPNDFNVVANAFVMWSP